jgi:methylsterol monooxygenase
MFLTFESHFLTSISDHMIVHWLLILILFTFDIYIYFSGNWNKYKLNNRIFSIPLTDTISQVLFNQIFVTFPLIYMFSNSFPEGTIFDPTNLYRIPTTFIMIEILFYYSHRLLHLSYFYEKFHKIHHKWIGPCAISTLYCHPLEQAISNTLPIILSGLFSGLNFSTMRLWHIFCIINGVLISHGGYKIPNYTNMHDLHHSSFHYNYGVLGILDKLHGTNYKSNSKSV